MSSPNSGDQCTILATNTSLLTGGTPVDAIGQLVRRPAQASEHQAVALRKRWGVWLGGRRMQSVATTSRTGQQRLRSRPAGRSARKRSGDQNSDRLSDGSHQAHDGVLLDTFFSGDSPVSSVRFDRPSTGAHAPAASSPRARSAGQPIIASRKKALSGRVTSPL